MEVQEREAILVRDLDMSLEATLSHLPQCVCVLGRGAVRLYWEGPVTSA